MELFDGISKQFKAIISFQGKNFVINEENLRYN